ncbi:unnamed protein product [Camellia sinensis]
MDTNIGLLIENPVQRLGATGAREAMFIPSAEALDTSYFMSRYVRNPEDENVGGDSDFDDMTETSVCTTDETCRYVRVSELFVYEKFSRVAAQAVEAGDICAVCGIDSQIGETIADKISGKPLPAIKVEEPTVKMAFSINTSPFVGREGKYVTSRNLSLYRELERNLAMKVEDGETADTFIISGRGTLHITILIENMEGYEFMVGPPKVINKRVNDKLLEPYEMFEK